MIAERLRRRRDCARADVGVAALAGVTRWWFNLVETTVVLALVLLVLWGESGVRCRLDLAMASLVEAIVLLVL